ncbi:tRNA dihydrouridine synthase DusB [Oceanibacterium hippocampi]|uniref:tRNA-dihydrouridine synthase n=1 Tax=Oceanibacterium hippocampi TaxID=745714 RepID=A0A1Y5T3K9_9PROT|nr:tRNA dihydrouridine synthase DusB [Oceanibacterium hippocampi]SLN54645.1 putative tRNA-dihydrouridine synthase [Oceanibacterium hippocampi]
MTIRIGPITVEGRVVLAPMSGISDLPFRRLARRAGVGLVVSEMIASRSMIQESRESMRLSRSEPEERPMAVQLAGCEPEVMAEAARLNADRGAEIIDINMGCPVKKVVSGQAGSALMRDLDHAARIIAATVRAVSLPVTLKMRTGWDMENRNAPELARIAENEGIRMITVHGRTRAQLFNGRADWRFVRRVREATGLPLIVNGDIAGVDDARAALEQSGADGVMIGRGAYGRPWLPGAIRRALDGEEDVGDPSPEAECAIVLEHYDAMLSHYGLNVGLRAARKHLGWYGARHAGGKSFRDRVMRLDEADAVRQEIRAFYAGLADQAANGIAA